LSLPCRVAVDARSHTSEVLTAGNGKPEQSVPQCLRQAAVRAGPTLPGSWPPGRHPANLTCAAMSLLQLEVGVSSTHGFCRRASLVRTAILPNCLPAPEPGTANHDVGGIAASELSSRVVIAKTRAPAAGRRRRRARCSDNGGFRPTRTAISRQSPWADGRSRLTWPVRCTSNPTCMSRITAIAGLRAGYRSPGRTTYHRRRAIGEIASVSSTSLSWSTSLSVLVISS